MLENEVFALRDGEAFTIREMEPTEGRWFGVMARSINMPEGEIVPVRPRDGALVAQAAILAVEKNQDGRWQWLILSPATKELIGDYLFGQCEGLQLDRWYYVRVFEKGEERKG